VVSRILVKVTLVLGPVFCAFSLHDRGIVPGGWTFIVVLLALIFGAWLATAALEEVMRDHLRDIESERQAQREAELGAPPPGRLIRG